MKLATFWFFGATFRGNRTNVMSTGQALDVVSYPLVCLWYGHNAS